MEIDINKNNFSIYSKCKIFIDGQQRYSASKKLFRWFSEINLFKDQENGAVYTINEKGASFKISYDLIRFDNNLFEFRTKNTWKEHYSCQVGQDLYEIYGHNGSNGSKYSIYKNDIQIAWWDKEAFVWSNDNYKIIADNDSDVELLISFCLIIDNASSNYSEGNTTSTKTVPQAKKFDTNWQPKS